MKYLKPYVNKEVEVILKNGADYFGYIWRYVSDESVYYAQPRYEYYIGYDGGIMTLIKPRDVIYIKELGGNESGTQKI